MVLQTISSILPNFLIKQVTNQSYQLKTKRYGSTTNQLKSDKLLEQADKLLEQADKLIGHPSHNSQ